MDKMKTILLGHGEKIAAGIFALFGLLALSSAAYNPSEDVLPEPSELVSSARKAEDAIAQNQWPEDQQKYTLISRQGTRNWKPTGCSDDGWMTVIVAKYQRLPP